MASMILPATNVKLPGQWALREFRTRPSSSEGIVKFEGMMVHKPSGQSGAVSNSGQGDKPHFDWYAYGSNNFKLFWEKFVADCGMEEEEVIQLFVDEIIQQNKFNSIAGTVVRTDDGDKIFDKSPEELRGEVQGKYWYHRGKRWVSLND